MEARSLTSAQERAVGRPVAPGATTILTGPAGSGRSTALVARAAWLVWSGVAAGAVWLVAPSRPAAQRLGNAAEAALDQAPWALGGCGTPADLALALLRAGEGADDPGLLPVSRADRLAMLLERVDELPLVEHDLAGRPALTLRRVLARIDACKAGATVPDPAAADPRDREFAALFAAHERLLAARGALSSGDLVLRAHARRLGDPAFGAAVEHVLVDDHDDLTPAAARFVAGLGAQLFVTTDPDQCTRPGPALANLTALRATRGSGAPGATAAAGRIAPPGADAAPEITPAAGATAATRAAPAWEQLALEGSHRCPGPVRTAAAALTAGLDPADRLPRAAPPKAMAAPGVVRFWRADGERARAQAVAAEVERLVRDGTAPEAIAILVGSERDEGRAIGVALEERAIAHRVGRGGDVLAQAEVRDVLAWLRLLDDPHDAAAVVRALARPPVSLRAADIARCVQISRRRKLDLVSALGAATESPQLPPEARERVLGFLKLHRQAVAALDVTAPDLFVHRLIARLGLRRQGLFAAQADAVQRLVSLARFGDLAAQHARRSPQASARDFGRYVAAVAEAGLGGDDLAGEDDATGRVRVLDAACVRGEGLDHVFLLGLPPGEPEARRRIGAMALGRARRRAVWAVVDGVDAGATALADTARIALGLAWDEREEELFGPDEALHATFAALRDELLGGVAQVGTRLGELRFDTDLDVTHGVTRYLELLKVSALLQRRDDQDVGDALADVNAKLTQAASSLQREVFGSSGLDDVLVAAEQDRAARRAALAARDEPSLAPFIPRRGEGLLLSASDIETYRSCPLKYKFARVFRIPQEPTLNQRFGILVHQVLERWHGAGSTSRDELLGLLDAGWRRGGFGDSEEERQFRAKAVSALHRYHDRHLGETSEPVWLEKAFQVKLGNHVLRGRVDRVDRLTDGGYELIDYKTGRPRTVEQLREDVQLSLYAVAAREAWQVESTSEAYHYVLDDEKVRVPADQLDPDWITDTVAQVAEGIQGQGFEPTPSWTACSMCDYRIACPVAER